MSHSLRLKEKSRSVAASGARCTENVLFISNEPGEGVRPFFDHEQCITLIAWPITDEGLVSDAGTTISHSMQRGGEFEKKPGFHTPQPLRRRRPQADGRRESLGCVASSIGENTDAMVYTMEWRDRKSVV